MKLFWQDNETRVCGLGASEYSERGARVGAHTQGRDGGVG